MASTVNFEFQSPLFITQNHIATYRDLLDEILIGNPKTKVNTCTDVNSLNASFSVNTVKTSAGNKTRNFSLASCIETIPLNLSKSGQHLEYENNPMIRTE